MRVLLPILIFAFISVLSYSQPEYQDSVRHKLSFQFNGDLFLKNNEYFNSYTEGFTSIGFIIQPKLQYKIDRKTTVSLGYYFLKYAGLNNFSETIPLFRLETKLTKDISILFGHLKSGRLHNLTEPLYRIDNDFQNQVEYGLQFLMDADWLKSDLWLHWEQFIQKDDPFPEEIYVGSTNKLRLYHSEKFELDWQAELLLSHLGGQIDLADNPDRTIINYSFGPIFMYSVSPDIKCGLDLRYYKSEVVKQVANANSALFIPFPSGFGWYPKMTMTSRDWNLVLGYWLGEEFVSPIGESLFLSVSDFDAEFVQSDRRLLTGHLQYSKEVFNYLHFEALTGLYYDIETNHLDYTYGIRALLKLDFKFLKNK